MSYKTYKRALEQEYKKTQQYQNDFHTYYKVREDRGDKQIQDYERSHIFDYNLKAWCEKERKITPDVFKKVFEETTLGNLNLVYEHVPTLKRLFELLENNLP